MGAAWIAAVSTVLTAIIVAIIGPILTRARRGNQADEDLDVIHALASALAAETEKRLEVERRAIECEAREQAREDRP